ncbi:general secretory pathway protein D [Nautilia profundicola AmH]|uniref:General secretory pathway protein D n=1 Tax=Nautilia profundicola (strain ATCC BAA-1463 / DSM 18972 / AmH) TaxID=598659 RepID=B9L5L8_NAUPA|nr:secretin and TonB N-terminal domain-containing protein [Nautilia profundicola]ACM93464.1 general secretory pathway protein D [Nautilia profundicola AmH]
MKKLVLILFIALSLFANCENKLFTYSNSINTADRLSIQEFLDLLVTQKCNINIVFDDKESKDAVKNKMPFLRVKNYTLNQVLDLILSKRGLFYTLNGDTLEISYYKTKTYKLDFISSNRVGESNLDATDSKVKNEYTFDFWDKVQDNIETILKNTSDEFKPPIIDKTVGLITVTGTKKQIDAIDKYINTMLNRLTKEVLIDVKIYTVELSKSHKTGIDWSQLSIQLNRTDVPLRGTYIGGAQSVFSDATFSVVGLLNFLAQNGNVNSLSNPKVVTLNNQKAIISVGDTIYYKYASKVTTDQNGNPNTEYTIDSKFVGVVLDITPQISDNGDIILSIAPRISAFKDLTQLSNTTRDMPPDTKDNTMLSVVKLKDNQTLVLGGLITNDKTLQVNGVPVLKEIPLIKYLFSSREEVTSRKELVFVITPHIINLKKKKTLRDLGFGKLQ